MRIDLRLQIFYLSLCSKKLFFIDFRDQIFDLPGHLIKPCADLIKLSCIKFPHLRIQSAVSKFPDIFSDKLQRVILMDTANTTIAVIPITIRKITAKGCTVERIEA